MLTFQSKGIIFRNIKYGETSIICDIFTEAKGLRSFIVSGVRSGKSKNKANIYRPLNLVDIHAYDGEGAKLTRIKEIQYSYIYQQLNYHVLRSSVGLFMLEIARNAIRSSESDLELFHFLNSSFIALDKSEHVHPLEPLLFMLRLSAFLGIEPMQNYKGDHQVFDLLNGQFDESGLASPYTTSKELTPVLHQLMLWTLGQEYPSLSKPVRQQLLEDLITYYKLHLAGFKDILSKDVLAGVL